MVERAARVLGPVLVTGLVVVGLLISGPGDPLALGAAAVAVVAVLGVAVLDARGWSLLAGCLVAGAALAVVCAGQPANLGWFGICVLAVWVALPGRAAPAVVFCVAAVALFAVQALAVGAESGWGAWPAGTVFSTIAALLASRERLLLEALREAQAGLADRARDEERTRIAREMHDIIGHTLSVTLLHLGSARLAVDDEPERARAALDEAERSARRSLEEVRASVGLLRGPGSGAGEVRPLPGGGDLADLVSAFRRTGTPVAWQVDGDPAALPATTGLAAYRIVQEALTNAARHAPGAATDVHVRVGADDVSVRVDSAGRPGPDHAGAGLAGMRERAEALGGALTAGPAGPGWRVEAVLPR